MKVFYINLKILRDFKECNVVEYAMTSINQHYLKVDPNFLKDLQSELIELYDYLQV